MYVSLIISYVEGLSVKSLSMGMCEYRSRLKVFQHLQETVQYVITRLVLMHEPFYISAVNYILLASNSQVSFFSDLGLWHNTAKKPNSKGFFVLWTQKKFYAAIHDPFTDIHVIIKFSSP